jgi:putative toxin-antitoxin system antitoxin component (TIGR02293 family)
MNMKKNASGMIIIVICRIFVNNINAMEVSDPLAVYTALSDGNARSLIDLTRKGIGFQSFANLMARSPFNLSEWAMILHISDRTLMRYKKENHAFDPLVSEKIIEIALLFNKGKEVFGDSSKFNHWLETDNIALGMIKPSVILDSTFGSVCER